MILHESEERSYLRDDNGTFYYVKYKWDSFHGAMFIIFFSGEHAWKHSMRIKRNVNEEGIRNVINELSDKLPLCSAELKDFSSMYELPVREVKCFCSEYDLFLCNVGKTWDRYKEQMKNEIEETRRIEEIENRKRTKEEERRKRLAEQEEKEKEAIRAMLDKNTNNVR